ncbi:phytanoyl-CoA dioxygenase family protein [Shewanella sp. KX20019]|uniref:phytanoyl-CoA dioxygenase family protein n=1 Tax=Shewanella sp. KX20019 TaxID=2803864 RepID=UPI0019256B25|nr:phytanoyl-CoA dioxygenase family protein [Shewanella sp. KX20019]QQX78948.1 phytanoyl-CoA dioxygenase family protein [Shewanella sp. KX20019]
MMSIDEVSMHVGAILNSNPSEIGAVKQSVESLTLILSEASGVDDLKEDDIAFGESLTAGGLAVSPTVAAKCAQDLVRTQLFIQGIEQAILDKSCHRNEVNILYAGTGPFGLLILPLLCYYKVKKSPIKLSLTLIDIHQVSIDGITKIINEFELQDYISEIIIADATKFYPLKGVEFDLIVSETMKNALKKEPQIFIFAHLQQFLKSDGVLIPERVQVSAWLTHMRRETEQLFTVTQSPLVETECSPIFMGTVYELNKHSALILQQQGIDSLACELSIPDSDSWCRVLYPDFKMSTEITVYKRFVITERQSDLTIPEATIEHQFVAGAKISFDYIKEPEWHFRWQTEQLQLCITLPDYSEVGDRAIAGIKRVWHKARLDLKGGLDPAVKDAEWSIDVAIMDKLGCGIEEWVSFVYASQTFTEFELWVWQRMTKVEQDQTDDAMLEIPQNKGAGEPFTVPDILSVEQLQQFDRLGYLIIESAIPAKQCEATISAIWQFLNKRADEISSWTEPHPLWQKTMVQMFEHPTLTANRNASIISQVYRQLYRHFGIDSQLCTTTDRVGFNPPETELWSYPGPLLHIDVNRAKATTFGLQGILYLTDTKPEQGAFTCVPGYHKKLNAVASGGLLSVAEGDDPYHFPNLHGVAIAAKAGDLIIWHHALPHGGSPNKADTPRIVQYINIYPEQDRGES